MCGNFSRVETIRRITVLALKVAKTSKGKGGNEENCSSLRELNPSLMHHERPEPRALFIQRHDLSIIFD